VEDRVGEKKIETAYYSTLVKVALTKDSESADPVQNLDQVTIDQFDQAMVQNL
jgi:callose synthase